MLRMTRVLASSLAVILVAGAMAPATANAWPLGKGSHLHPSADQGKGSQIAVQLYNKGKLAQDVKVDGTIYTVPPLQSITIKASEGAAVYAYTEGKGYSKGDVLFTYSAALKGAKISFN